MKEERKGQKAEVELGGGGRASLHCQGLPGSSPREQGGAELGFPRMSGTEAPGYPIKSRQLTEREAMRALSECGPACEGVTITVWGHTTLRGARPIRGTVCPAALPGAQDEPVQDEALEGGIFSWSGEGAK